MFQLEDIDHIALTVRDLARSIAFYRDVLGMERRHQDVWGDYPVFMCLGKTGLALFPAIDAGPAAMRDVRRAPVMHHFAFRTDRANFQKAQETSQRRGIEFEFQYHQIEHSIYFRDPDGHEVEITTYDLPKER